MMYQDTSSSSSGGGFVNYTYQTQNGLPTQQVYSDPNQATMYFQQQQQQQPTQMDMTPQQLQYYQQQQQLQQQPQYNMMMGFQNNPIATYTQQQPDSMFPQQSQMQQFYYDSTQQQLPLQQMNMMQSQNPQNYCYQNYLLPQDGSLQPALCYQQNENPMYQPQLQQNLVSLCQNQIPFTQIESNPPLFQQPILNQAQLNNSPKDVTLPILQPSKFLQSLAKASVASLLAPQEESKSQTFGGTQNSKSSDANLSQEQRKVDPLALKAFAAQLMGEASSDKEQPIHFISKSQIDSAKKISQGENLNEEPTHRPINFINKGPKFIKCRNNGQLSMATSYQKVDKKQDPNQKKELYLLSCELEKYALKVKKQLGITSKTERPSNLEYRFVSDIEALHKRIKSSSKLLSLIFDNLLKGGSLDRVQHIVRNLRFSFQIKIKEIETDLVHKKNQNFRKIIQNPKSKAFFVLHKDDKQISSNEQKSYQVLQILIDSVGRSPKKVTVDDQVNLDRCCKLHIEKYQFQKFVTDQNNQSLLEIDFIVEGLQFQIKDPSNLLFKFKQSSSKIFKAETLDDFELDLNQDIQITLQELDKDKLVKLEKAVDNFTNARSLLHADINLQPKIGDLKMIYNKIQQIADKAQMKSVGSILQYRITKDVSTSIEKQNYKNELLKLFTIEDMFKSLASDFVPIVCGILKNVQIIQDTINNSPNLPLQSLLSLRNTYIGELHSLIDDNYIIVILVEEGFTPITQNLLDGDVIVCFKNAKRLLSSNLEIYLEVKITLSQVNLIGKPAPCLYNDRTALEDFQDQSITQINFVSPEIITRNMLLIKGKIVDINFIKFEFVCQLCRGGTLLSSARCINQCKFPRPLLKIVMRLTIEDEKGGKAFMSVNDDRCCRIFGIDLMNIDIFKEYFFLHGPFLYKSYQKFTKEYSNVLAFFKRASSQRLFIFECQPYCKVGYEDNSLSLFQQSNLNEQHKRLVNMIKLCYKLQASKEMEGQLIQEEFNRQCEKFQVQKQVYVNGEVREAIDFTNRKVLRQFLCLKCRKIVEFKKAINAQQRHDLKSNFGIQAFEDVYRSQF